MSLGNTKAALILATLHENIPISHFHLWLHRAMCKCRCWEAMLQRNDTLQGRGWVKLPWMDRQTHLAQFHLWPEGGSLASSSYKPGPVFGPMDWAGAWGRPKCRGGRTVILDTAELDGLGIPDLFIHVCFARALLLGKMCLPSTFHLDSDWSSLVLRKKTTITAETGSCELIFSLTCIDYNVKDSKSIHLNVSLEKKI